MNIAEASAELQSIISNKESVEFSIAFCGVFSSGKTSLINYLLDYEDYKFPTGVKPITKIPTIIRYGNEFACFTVTNNIKKNYSKESLARIICGTIKLPDRCNEIIVELPAKILMNGVIFIDTPGFSDEEELETISRKAVLRSDFVVMCANATQLGNLFEKGYVEELEDSIGNACFVVTRVDNLNTQKDVEDLRKQGSRMFTNSCSEVMQQFGYKNVFYTACGESVKILDGLDSVVGSLICNTECKNRLKRSTSKIKKRYLLRNLLANIEENLIYVKEEEARLKKMQLNHTIDREMRRIQRENKLYAIQAEYTTILCDAFSEVETTIRKKENENITDTYIKDVQRYLMVTLMKVSYKIDTDLYSAATPDWLTKVFYSDIASFDIPTPNHSTLTRTWVERVATAALEGVAVDSVPKSEIKILPGYATRTVNDIETYLKPLLFERLKEKIMTYFQNNESKSFDELPQLTGVHDTILLWNNLRDQASKALSATK